MTSQNHSLTTLGGSGDHAPDDGMQSGRSRLFDGRATMNSFSATVLHEAASSDKISEKISDASDKFSKEKGCQEAPVSGDSNDDKPVKKKLCSTGPVGGPKIRQARAFMDKKKGGWKNKFQRRPLFHEKKSRRLRVGPMGKR